MALELRLYARLPSLSLEHYGYSPNASKHTAGGHRDCDLKFQHIAGTHGTNKSPFFFFFFPSPSPSLPLQYAICGSAILLQNHQSRHIAQRPALTWRSGNSRKARLYRTFFFFKNGLASTSPGTDTTTSFHRESRRDCTSRR